MTAVTTRRLTANFDGVLPRSLAPWPDESLAGYVLRLGLRLRRSPIDVMQVAGLVGTAGRDVPGIRALILDPDRLAGFAKATRMTHDEARALTLHTTLGTVLPLANPMGGVAPLKMRAHWALPSGRTRACPDCLAGPDARWRRSWQLPWHFACLDHGRLLLDACPACRIPYGRERATGPEGHLVPGASVPGLPLNACRATTSTARHHVYDPIPRCGHLLGSPSTLAASAPVDDPLALTAQQRLLDAASTAADRHLLAAGAPVPPDVWFDTLRALCGLLRLARPAIPLVPLPGPLADALDALDADRARADDDAAASALVAFRSPPTTPALTAALAVQALSLLDLPHWDALADATAPLRRRARYREPRISLRPLPGMRPEARRLVRAEHGGGLLSTWLVLAPTTDRWTYTARNVPHRVDDTAWHRHFSAFADLAATTQRSDSQTRVRRCAAVGLVQLAHRCSQQHALALLGVHATAGYAKNLAELDDALAAAGRATAFRDALHAAARDIEDDPDRTDHQALRQALNGWAIPEDDWAGLVARLRPLQHRGPVADWGDPRRLCTTATVWEHLTGGDILYAPVLEQIPQDDQRRFGGYLSNYRARLHTGRIAGWDDIVVPYAHRVANDISACKSADLHEPVDVEGVR